MFLSFRSSSLKGPKNVLQKISLLYLRKEKTLSLEDSIAFKALMLKLKEAIEEKNRSSALELAQELKLKSKLFIKKNILDYGREGLLGIAVTLLFAGVIRQTWFEPYEIPTGSMRPTFFEKDRVIASKSCYGINIPFLPKHFYFDPSLMKRGSFIIFTAEGLDMEDPNMLHFYLFPGKKRLIKRLIGLPGDTLYFYGGKIYGFDKNGDEITTFHAPEFAHLEYVPFISFEGKVTSMDESTHILSQMNQPIVKFSTQKSGGIKVQSLKSSFQNTLDDLYGMRHFAMCRLLEESPSSLAPADYYLEFLHTPHYTRNKPHLGCDLTGRLRPILSLERSYLPLSKEYLSRIQQNLYTGRFVVENETAQNYSASKQKLPDPFRPSLPHVPNGTYEFYDGVAYQIKASGIRKALDKTHPLYQESLIPSLFNLGMQMISLFNPQEHFDDFIPYRYAYFKEGDLYLMGHPFLIKQDPILLSYLEEERSKQYPFSDKGPPYKEGVLDYAYIERHGLKIPEGMYLGLGDNHAGSSDCRDFGLIPEDLIQGTSSFLVWPPTSHWGRNQGTKPPFFSFPNCLIWSLGVSAFAWTYISHRRARKRLEEMGL